MYNFVILHMVYKILSKYIDLEFHELLGLLDNCIYSKRTKVFAHHKSQVYSLCHLLTKC